MAHHIQQYPTSLGFSIGAPETPRPFEGDLVADVGKLLSDTRDLMSQLGVGAPPEPSTLASHEIPLLSYTTPTRSGWQSPTAPHAVPALQKHYYPPRAVRNHDESEAECLDVECLTCLTRSGQRGGGVLRRRLRRRGAGRGLHPSRHPGAGQPRAAKRLPAVRPSGCLDHPQRPQRHHGLAWTRMHAVQPNMYRGCLADDWTEECACKRWLGI